jgi:hypothetical protein
MYRLENGIIKNFPLLPHLSHPRVLKQILATANSTGRLAQSLEIFHPREHKEILHAARTLITAMGLLLGNVRVKRGEHPERIPWRESERS